jgi:hypothetical protein
MTTDVQGSLFGDGRMVAPTRSATPDPQVIRARLGRLLDSLRAAETMPLTDHDLRMWRTVVPNMSRWLPDDEAATVRAEFTAEVERLGAQA